MLTSCHVATGGASDRHQKGMPLDRDLTVHSPDASSNGGGTSWKNSTITARSSRDHGAIEPQSRRFWRGIVRDSSPIDRQAIDEALASRLTPDRGAIVAKIAAEIGVSLRLI